MNPVARHHGLLVRTVGEEIVVYDLTTHRAHCLGPAAAAVFRMADGSRSESILAAEIAEATGGAVGADLAARAVDELGEAGLLDPASRAAPGASRREMLRRAGLGMAAALPLVSSLVAPTPAEAAATCVSDCTNQPPGTPCDSFGGCPNTTNSCCDTGVPGDNSDNVCSDIAPVCPPPP
jgi:hypothetical protein